MASSRGAAKSIKRNKMSDPPTYSFEELIQSKLFKFYIGKEKKAFVLHSKAIAATSWHFHALVNNGMAQSQEGSVEYPDMEPEDFARYVEYAYRCDYTVPDWATDDTVSEDSEPDVTVEDEPIEAPEEPSPPPREPDQEWDGSDSHQPTTAEQVVTYGQYLKKKRAKEEIVGLRTRFDEREYLTSDEPKTTLLANFTPEGNVHPEQDFTSVFLAHARLYTFACMRLIDPLKSLTLHKLHQTLLKFSLYDRRVGDVIELARYAYDHGEDRKPDGTIEDLRTLVVEYIAREVLIIGRHQAFAPLLQEGGEFVVDFWRIIIKENLVSFLR